MARTLFRRRRVDFSYRSHLLGIIRTWEKSGGKWPASADQIAEFALDHKLWDTPKSRMRRLCARELARVMREDYLLDERGRPVRRLHAALRTGQDDEGNNTQRMLWDDIRTADRDHMEVAFQLRRQQIVGDCRQLQIDAEYFNNRHLSEKPIQLCFNFMQDLAERDQPTQYRDQPTQYLLPPKG
jgi:hypothetical protein